MRIQLPDYDEFQRYDLGAEPVLSQIPHKVYADFHNPPMQTLKRNLFIVGIQKRLFRELGISLKTMKGRFRAGKDVWQRI